MRLIKMHPEMIQADTTHGTNKEKKELTLYKDNIEYVKKIKAEQGLRSLSAAVDYIIMQHKKMTDEQTDIVAEKLSPIRSLMSPTPSNNFAVAYVPFPSSLDLRRS